MIRFLPFEDAAAAAAAQADAVAQRLRGLLAARCGTVALALSGGRSPIAFFDALSRQPLDWSRVELRLVDERLVAVEHAHSNERLLRAHLLQAQAAAAHCVGLAPTDAAAMTAPHAQAAIIERANAQQVPIDLAVLGMGTDGHIASLFPHAPEYAAATGLGTDASYALLHPDPTRVDPPLPRISLTLAALLAARGWQLAIAGAAKRGVFEQAVQAGANPELPISLLLANLPTGAPFDVYWHP